MPWEYQRQQYYPPNWAYAAGALYGGALYQTYRHNNPAAVPKNARQRTIEPEKSSPTKTKSVHMPQQGATKFLRTKPRPMASDKVKGVSKSLQRKVEKVIQHSKVYGKYTYIADVQLRQQNHDLYAFYTGDRNGQFFDLFTPYQFLDAASVLFSGKAINLNSGITAGNLNDDQKLSIQNSYVDIDFKSTSSHVVNLEIYECSPKVNTDKRPHTHVEESYNTYDAVINNGATNYALNPLQLGTSPSDWVQLFDHYHVKTHHVKLQPGMSTKLFIQGPKSKFIDLTKFNNNGTLYNHGKNLSKALFIRVINDATVSGSFYGGAGAYVHHWQSNNFGGVAMLYRRVIRMNPPDSVNASSTESINRIRTGVFLHNLPGTNIETDQQVAYQNPKDTTNVD